MTTSTIIIIAVLAAAVAFSVLPLLNKAGQEVQHLRADNLEAKNTILRLRTEVKRLSEILNLAGERNKGLEAELAKARHDLAIRTTQLTEAHKREERRKERELRKSMQRQNELIKKEMEEEKERKAKFAKRKRKFVKPHAINPHNPQKK